MVSNAVPRVKGFVRLPVANRFWGRVNKSGGPDACWLWTGSKADRGYGIMSVNGKSRRATWVSWELHHGEPFPAGKMACHTCDIPSCVNPTHLFIGTMSDNIKDAVQKGRLVPPPKRGLPPWNKNQTRCKRGHELSPNRKGGRVCEVCRKARERVRQAGRKK